MARKFRELVAKMPPDRQERIRRRVAKDLQAMRLADLRKARQQSQVELASALEMTQSEISKVENRADMYISTLRKYVEGLGGRLELLATFKDGEIRIGSLGELGTET